MKSECLFNTENIIEDSFLNDKYGNPEAMRQQILGLIDISEALSKEQIIEKLKEIAGESTTKVPRAVRLLGFLHGGEDPNIRIS